MRKSLASASFSVLLLAGCSNESEKLLRQYEIATDVRELTYQEKCRFESQIRDAFLREENIEKYKAWDERSEMTCWFASRE